MRKYLVIVSMIYLLGFVDNSASEVKKITTTTNLIADLVRNIAGSAVEVKSLMGPGVDPHLYKATQGDLRLLLDADLIFYNGLHLEGKMGDILSSLSKKRSVIAVTDSIDRSRLRRPPEFEGQYDPHVWFDPNLWSKAAEVVTLALKTELSLSAPEIDQRLADYLDKLKVLNSWTKEQINRIPPTQRVLITAHDAFGYFGIAYQIEVIGLQGISTAAEYGLQDIARLSDTIVSRKLKSIFVESSVSPRSIEALQSSARARGVNVSIGGQLYSDSLGPPEEEQGSYLGMFRFNVKTIVEALI